MRVLRSIFGLLCGAATAAVGALVLGEYEFTGTLPFVAGPLFGLVIGEVVVTAGRDRRWPVAVATAALAFGGTAWAGWIDSSEGLEPMNALVWVAAALAAGTAGLRTAQFRRAPAPG